MGKVTLETKWSIVTLARENLPSRAIAARLGCAQRTVAAIVKRFKETGSIERKKGSGRPRKTTIVEDHFIRLQCLRNRFKTSVELKADLYRARRTEISSRTVRRRLVTIGLPARRPVVKPALTAFARQNRLCWAREHIKWTDEMWDSVIFSDESKFKLHESDGRLFVRRKKGERLSEDCLQMMPPKTEGVMVWGCFSGDQTGHLTFIDQKITADVYIHTLQHHLEPSVIELFGDTCDFIFQQDNAPVHTAKKVCKLLNC